MCHQALNVTHCKRSCAPDIVNIMFSRSGKPTLAQLKLHTRAYYKRIGVVHCPILDEDVHFTSEGYNHLINESNSTPGKTKPRSPAEQYLKLIHLTDVKAVLKYSVLIDETRKVRKKVKDKWKDVIQYEIICAIKGVRVSVVVEKVGDGKHKFLSVFPTKKDSTKNAP